VLYDSKLQKVASKIEATPPQSDIELNYSDLIKKSVGGEGVSEIRTSEKGDFLVVVMPLSQTIEGKVSIWGYILTLNQIPHSITLKIESIRKTYEDYKQQSFLKLPVSTNYYITFLLVTLLILFSAIWLGFYMARGITVPIQQLAEGTRRIAGGDLNFKIDISASDEIGILVDSFNTMTTEINENRKKLQWANEDLKTINIELERRRSYIETILENIGAGVISIDKRGYVTTLNKAAKRILGIEARDFLGATYKYIFDPSFNEPIRKTMKRMIRDQKEFVEEQIEIMVGENHLTLLVNIRLLLDPGKKYLGIVILFEDLTQMIKAQKIAAWKEVAQGIAHEIRNPLTPIQLNAQRLRKKFYENKEDFARVFEESIRIIDQEVEGMKDLLGEFLRFARMPTPNPRPTDLHKLIDDVAVLYSGDEKKLIIKKNYDPNITLIKIDSEQIRRAFINLFVNAIDAIEDNGIIEITTRVTPLTKRIRIEFSDNGIGILPGDRDKLFLPHFTTKKRGTGLGLAIVHRIIADHNGVIQVRDNSPKGTVFVIELPATPSNSASKTAGLRI
jgi:two-component system nitrogen regulation sensor histidine kinase NtrY